MTLNPSKSDSGNGFSNTKMDNRAVRLAGQLGRDTGNGFSNTKMDNQDQKCNYNSKKVLTRSKFNDGEKHWGRMIYPRI